MEQETKERGRESPEAGSDRRHKGEELTKLKIKNAYLKGRIVETENANVKLTRENERLREQKLQLVCWQTKANELNSEF